MSIDNAADRNAAVQFDPHPPAPGNLPILPQGEDESDDAYSRRRFDAITAANPEMYDRAENHGDHDAGNLILALCNPSLNVMMRWHGSSFSWAPLDRLNRGERHWAWTLAQWSWDQGHDTIVVDLKEAVKTVYRTTPRTMHKHIEALGSKGAATVRRLSPYVLEVTLRKEWRKQS